ncbi:hypothetical protein [Vitreoscilla stercoraria]|uniref:Uncharacterized protein n=1 Tax=Vitreoscilla stercoraria TaxID=61 RepID=A0ABY4ECT5_VITST|nr:hypothetical protein [Vitreoscilla stercoraria]UOO93564.1 hypothetical protein LVJ81_05945 [Vitreoscilla stercoraria]
MRYATASVQTIKATSFILAFITAFLLAECMQVAYKNSPYPSQAHQGQVLKKSVSFNEPQNQPQQPQQGE